MLLSEKVCETKQQSSATNSMERDLIDRMIQEYKINKTITCPTCGVQPERILLNINNPGILDDYGDIHCACCGAQLGKNLPLYIDQEPTRYIMFLERLETCGIEVVEVEDLDINKHIIKEPISTKTSSKVWRRD